jgi:tetratricopeptide (TPR) repeat protein
LFAHDVRGSEVFGLVDELTQYVLSDLGLAPGPTAGGIAEVTSGSLEAHRLYTAGLEAHNNLRYADALELYQQAAEIDPSFAMAHFEMWLLGGSLGDGRLEEEHRRVTLENLERLPERQRLLVQIAETWVTDLEKDPSSA